MDFIAQKIEIFADNNILAGFYSSSSKIIISSCDREIYLNSFKDNQNIDIYEFACHNNPLKSTIQILGTETKISLENLAQITLPPSFCVCLLSLSAAGTVELTKLLNWWKQKNSGQLIPDLIELNGSQELVELQKDFWEQMYLLEAQQNQVICRRITTLQKQYLNLRTLHEEMQNAFATVEEYLSQAKLPPVQLAFDTQTTDQTVDPTTISGSNSAILHQLLPLSSRGLAAIELHIAKHSPQAVGDLKISLKACEDVSNLAVWKIPYSHLSPGWFGLDLPNINLGRKRDVELITEWQTKIGPAPSLSLTKKQPILESKAYNSSITLDNSLAIRIWQGLPGTRKVANPYLVVTVEPDQDLNALPSLGYLGQKAMTRLQEVTPNLPTEDFEHIQILKEGAKVMTHPRIDGTPTIAMLPYCFPPSANHLTASVITDHPEAGVIEYAIAIIDPETDPKTALDHNIAQGFSGWIAVEPNVHRKIPLDLGDDMSQHAHIVIATRMIPGNPIDFAWSHWLDFHTASIKSPASKPPASKPLTANSPDSKPPVSESPASKSIAVNSPVINSNPVASPSIDLQQIKLRDVSSPLLPAKFKKVKLIEQENKIQIHPTKEGETIAIVSNAIKSGTTKVESTVCTENEAASTIEYAMAVIAQDDNTIARLAIASPTSALGFSGWQSVPANTLHNLEVALNTATEDICHLVVATRLPQNSSQSNAWARWLNIKTSS